MCIEPSLIELPAIRLSPQAGKSLVIPRRRESCSNTMPPRSGQCQDVALLREGYPIDWIPACTKGRQSTIRQSGCGIDTAGVTKQRGISLIELIMFIVIISVALAAILLVMSRVTGHSADPLVRKQALAIAESLLEEIELMPFTYCDPNDPSGNAGDSTITTGTGTCTPGWSQDVVTGPTPNTETRYSTADPFDNVADYSAFHMSPILDIAGNGVGLASYTADVAIVRAGTALLGAADSGAALRITVTVTGPGDTSVALDGYRTRYAPNGVP